MLHENNTRQNISNAKSSILETRGLIAGYGQKKIVHGVDLEVNPGEIVALIGHNGAGKSTLFKTLYGLLPVDENQVYIDGVSPSAINPLIMLEKGVAFVPQGNNIFPDLTVAENLQIGGIVIKDKLRLKQEIERVLCLFPTLKPWLSRYAGTLSGGERQMLGLATAFIPSPRLLLLDEPSLGLSPSLVVAIIERIQQLSKETGVAAFIVEQKVREVLKVSDRVYVLRAGLVSFSGSANELWNEETLREVYL